MGMDLEALKKKALSTVSAEQDLLAQAYQIQQRKQASVEYGYHDALDAVIWSARQDPEKFMRDDLPALRRIADEHSLKLEL